MTSEKFVQVRMREQTLSQVDHLKENLHAPSRSDAIRRAVELGDAMANIIKNGHKIIIEYNDGRETRVSIPGVVTEIVAE